LEIISPQLEILPDAEVTYNVIPQTIRKSDVNNFTSDNDVMYIS